MQPPPLNIVVLCLYMGVGAWEGMGGRQCFLPLPLRILQGKFH